MYSESELTENDSYSESDEEFDEESDTINSVDECDEAPEDEPKDKVLHDIDPNMFLQEFRTICQRRIQTWENYRKHDIVEYTKTKDKRNKRRESIIDKSKKTIQEESISTGGGSMTPLKSDIKALAIEPAAKYTGTPKTQIHNQSKNWENSRTHKTKDITKTADSITAETNIQSMQQFGQRMRKYVANDIAELSDDDEMQQFVTVDTKKATKSNGFDEHLYETVTTTTTTTTVKKIRRQSMLSSISTPLNALTIDSDPSCDDSEPRSPRKKEKIKKRYNVNSDECPITPKKQLTSSHHNSMNSIKSPEMASSFVLCATPRRTTIFTKEKMEKEYLARCSNEDYVDTSHFRSVRVDSDQTLKIIVPKTPRSSNTPNKRSKLLAIDQTPHKDSNIKRDILSTILDSPLIKKPIIACEK